MHRRGKQTLRLLLLALTGNTLVACGVAQTGGGSGGPTTSRPIATASTAPSATPNVSSPTVASVSPAAPTSGAQHGSISDLASLMIALQAAGASVAVNGTIQQPFLQVPGTQVSVDGQDVQVFEYSDAAAAQVDALKLADVLAGKDTTMVNWVASPHAYQAGRLVALYVGDDAATLKRLQQVLGAPTAELQRPPREAIGGTIFGGVGVDGGGFIIVGGKVIPVPPWDPMLKILEQIALYRTSEAATQSWSRDAVRREALTVISEHIETLAEELNPFHSPPVKVRSDV